MKKHPFIIIFDIDQTIIGNVNMQSKENDLLEFIYNTCKKKGINNECQNIDLDMQEELNNGLLRPYVRDFITLCDKKFKNVEVFFYTNSNYKWTNKILGKSIEKALNIKINRPFFTRENSMTQDLKKSLANVYPLIIKSLLKKYPSMKDEKNTEYILNNRTIFIDDIKNNIISYTNRQLVCPAYDYYSYYNIYEKLITKYKMDPKIFNNKDILKYMEDNDIYIYNKNGSLHQKNKDYVNIANMYKTKHSQLSTELSKDTDTYFKDLITKLSNKSVSDDYLSNKDIVFLNKIKRIKDKSL
jgi:hypothetical protein